MLGTANGGRPVNELGREKETKMILFTRGNPAEEALPIDDIVDCAKVVFQREGKILFQYGHYSGYAPLREWIAQRVGVLPERVLLGNSSMEFLSFVAALMMKPGDTVFVESPSYDRAITAMRRSGVRVVGIPLERDGVNVDLFKEALQRSVAKIFYLIPDFQNPSGVTTSLEKRKEIVCLAQEFGFYIVEDSPYRYLRYRGTALPTIRELMPDRVLHISSFSKILSPGMRVGFILLPPDLAPQFHKWSEDTYIHPVLPTEGIVNEYCRRGLLDRNIERLKALYRPRMEAMLSAVAQYLRGVQYVEPDGGYFISIHLPNEVDGHSLWKHCRDFGIVLTDGRGFFPDGKGQHFLRLPFSALTPEEIEEGIRRLAKAIDYYRR